MWQVRAVMALVIALAIAGAYFYGRSDGKTLGVAECVEASEKLRKAEDELAELKLKGAQRAETRNRERLAETETKTRQNSKEVQDYVEANPKDDACRLNGDDVRVLQRLVDEANAER